MCEQMYIEAFGADNNRWFSDECGTQEEGFVLFDMNKKLNLAIRERSKRYCVVVGDPTSWKCELEGPKEFGNLLGKMNLNIRPDFDDDDDDNWISSQSSLHPYNLLVEFLGGRLNRGQQFFT